MKSYEYFLYSLGQVVFLLLPSTHFFHFLPKIHGFFCGWIYPSSILQQLCGLYGIHLSPGLHPDDLNPTNNPIFRPRVKHERTRKQEKAIPSPCDSYWNFLFLHLNVNKMLAGSCYKTHRNPVFKTNVSESSEATERKPGFLVWSTGWNVAGSAI